MQRISHLRFGTTATRTTRRTHWMQHVGLVAQHALLALLLAACDTQAPAQPAEQAIRPARIFVVRETSGKIHHAFVGQVEAAQSIDVSFEVSGPLAELSIREGQALKRGELIAALDDTDFRLNVREAEVELQLARQDLARKRQVLAQKSIAPSLVDDAQAMFELKEVRLAQARESLADSRIHAPFDAFVARRYLDNFVNVRAGDRIARLHDLHKLLIVTSMPEELLATVTTDRVIRVDAEFAFLPGKLFEIEYLENRGEADAVAQTFEVTFNMTRPQEWRVLPGMTATVHVQLRSVNGEKPVTFIPASALVSDSGNRFFVWLHDTQTQVVTRRDVTVAAPTPEGVPILKGLSEGDAIVAAGANQLTDGMRVRPLGTNEPPP